MACGPGCVGIFHKECIEGVSIEHVYTSRATGRREYMSLFGSGGDPPVRQQYDEYLNATASRMGPWQRTQDGRFVYADVRTRTSTIGGPVNAPPVEAVLFYTDKVKVGVGRVQVHEGGEWMVFIQWPENMERVPPADAKRLADQIAQYSKECDALNKKVALEAKRAANKAKRGRRS
jgi:hypothetical protein